MNLRFQLCLIMVFSLCIPGLVNAGLLAKWSMQRGMSMTMEFKDEKNFRINAGEHSYILMSKGEGYTVSKQGDEWVATSIASIRKMMEESGMGDLMNQAQAGGDQHEDMLPKLEDTGKTETVAGMKGQVYHLIVDPKNTKEKPLEIVFSDDPRLARIQQAHMRLGEAWGKGMHGQKDGSLTNLMQRYDQDGPGGALLRYADIMRLESLEEVDLKDSRFTVPRIAEMGQPGMPHGAMKGHSRPPRGMPKLSPQQQEQFRRAMEELQKKTPPR